MLLLPMLSIISCVTFPTSYGIIESNKPRLLDFIYEPAEAAPGDTVIVKAIFAGKKVRAEDLTWRMSGNIITNEYGETTVLDTTALPVSYRDISFSDSTSCVAFTFVVPEDILVNTPYIPENWISLLPDYYQREIGKELPASKRTILSMLELASAPDGAALLPVDSSIAPYLPMLLQLFSLPMQLYCDVQNSHRIRSSFVVRYNRRFSAIGGIQVPLNHNPRIDSAVVYQVNKESLASFDPGNCPYTFTRTPLSPATVNALVIDRKKSYFIGIYNNVIDTTLSIDGVMGESKPLTETIGSHWYVHYNDDELDKVGTSERIEIVEGSRFDNQIISSFYPSLSDDITSVLCWVELTDSFLNEMNRPVGSTLGEYRLSFTYVK